MNPDRERYNNIKAPAAADIVIEQAIKRGGRHLKFRRNIASIMVSALVCTSVLLSGFVSPTMAGVLVKMPVVGSIFEKSVDKGLRNIYEKGLSDSQDMQITSDGITVALKEVYYDKTGISISYIVKGKNAQAKQFSYFMFYNEDKNISGGGSGEVTNISNDEYSGVTTLVTSEQLPDNFNLRVVFSDNPDKKSPYDFTVPVSRAKTASETKEVAIMKSESAGDRAMTIKNAIFTPASITLNLEYTRPINEEYFTLQLLNQDNQEVQLKSVGGGIEKKEEKITDSVTAIFDPFDTIPEKLKLRVLNNEQEAVMEIEFDGK